MSEQTAELPERFCTCTVEDSGEGSQPCFDSVTHPGELQCGYGVNDIE